MRKIIAAINMTLDGFCDHTAGIPDDEIHQHYTDLLNNGGVILYGRITYQLMQFWQTLIKKPSGKKTMDDFAVAIDKIPKIVFSHTLKNTEWDSARLSDQPIEEEVLTLKQQSGKDILVGSRSLIIQLMKLNRIDEYQLCVHPVVAGSGLPLFENINDRTILKLIKTKTFGGGAVTLYYEPTSLEKGSSRMIKLKTVPIMEFKTAGTFETWLRKNHDNSNGLWLKIFKKHSEKKTITYAEALDVALCYGWIDGQKQAHDEQAWLQKFCPRSAKSIWSKINIGHVERLMNEGRMTPAGLEAVEKAKADGRWGRAYDSPSKMTIPEDFLKELSKNKKAEAFFRSLNKTNLFSIGFRLQTAKKRETREKRMKEIIKMLAEGEKFH